MPGCCVGRAWASCWLFRLRPHNTLEHAAAKLRYLEGVGSEQQGWLRTAASAASAGMVASGLIGAPVAAWLGPYLAMGLAIWGGWTTEPTAPVLGYPWLLTVAGLVAWGLGLRLQSRTPRAIWLTQGAAVLVALLPWVHLWRLWSRAA